MDLKEKLQNINKKKISIILLIILIVVVASLGSFQYVKNNNKEKQRVAEIQRMAEEAAKEQAQTQEQSEQPKRPSEYAVGEDYNKAMKSKKPVLTLFYADWCGYCIRFMPIFEKLSEKYGNDMVFAKVNVEDPAYQEVVKDFSIGGFPTVYILDPKYDNRVLLSNSVLGSVDNVSVELDRFLKIRKILDKKS